MKLAGYLNVNKTETASKTNILPGMGPGILYFLASEKGFENMGLPRQNFGMKLTVQPKAEPMLKESLESDDRGKK